MTQKDKRIDKYIARSQPFARPILKHLRSLVHTACPSVDETMKWSFPHFEYRGEMMCSMASFKQHCAFGFWKASLLKNKTFMANARGEKAMGHLGRITSPDDLPPHRVLIASIKEAMRLNDAGIKVKKSPAGKSDKELIVPKQLRAALISNAAAKRIFDAFSYSNKKEYVEWIADAKSDEPRMRRIDTAIEWLSEGKPRNWKYLRKK